MNNWNEFYTHFYFGRRTVTPKTDKAKWILKKAGYPALSKYYFKNKKYMIKHKNYMFYVFNRLYYRY